MAIRTYELTIVSEASTKKVQFALPDKLGLKYRIKLNLSDGKSIYAADPSSIIGAAKVIQNTGIAQTFKMKARLGTPSTPSQFWQTVDVGNFTTPGIARNLSLQDATWDDISTVSKFNIASMIWSVGDEKTITLSTGEQVTLVILGFNHDDLADGSGKAGITFGMKNLLADTYIMNGWNDGPNSDTNEGGWNECEMRTETMEAVFSTLPLDLQSAIRQVNKKTTSGNYSKEITTSIDKLFLFSEVEIDGTEAEGYASEGGQYEYWKTVKDGKKDEDREKFLSNGEGRSFYWWLRSPVIKSGSKFLRIGGDILGLGGGYIEEKNSNTSSGICFCFCV